LKLLLPQTNYRKACLHTHSTVSDGKLTPEEVRDAYRAEGYGILALTDHSAMIAHNDLTEPDFLMLTGMEINYNAVPYRRLDGKTYHFNLIAKQPDNIWTPWNVRSNYPQAQEYAKLMECENMDIRYDVDATNAMIAKANEKGFLVMYNHPNWSCHSFPDYAPLKGLWGMELRNSECIYLGSNDNTAWVFREMVNLGNKIYPVGTDDMHHPETLGRSWIMVGAEKLEYGAVIDALEKGAFYMSCGPEIYDLTVEDDKLKISCSDARHIMLETHGRCGCLAEADGQNWLKEATFDLSDFIKKAEGDANCCIILTVTAPDGSYATTRGYYLNELL
jgi:hypothetical protein